jgi:hypothetical protein
MRRFLSNPRVTPRELAQSLREAAREAVAQQRCEKNQLQEKQFSVHIPSFWASNSI